MTITAEDVIYGLGLLVQEGDAGSYHVNVDEVRVLLAHIDAQAAQIDELKDALICCAKRSHDSQRELAALTAETREYETGNCGDWSIDDSTGTPILMYQDCSVIEAEQARFVIGLIANATGGEVAE
jgi:hypothetical protein